MFMILLKILLHGCKVCGDEKKGREEGVEGGGRSSKMKTQIKIIHMSREKKMHRYLLGQLS